MDYTSFIPAGVRARIIQFLVSKIGGALVPLIAAGVALCIHKLVSFSPPLMSLLLTSSGMDEAHLQQAIVAFVWGVLMIAVNYATNHWLTRDAKAVQEALVKTGAALDVDGWIGEKTVKAIEAQGIEVRKAVPIDAPPVP
jgi:hypothetical protein